MEKNFISFEKMFLWEADDLNRLGLSVIADGDSKTIIINMD